MNAPVKSPIDPFPIPYPGNQPNTDLAKAAGKLRMVAEILGDRCQTGTDTATMLTMLDLVDDARADVEPVVYLLDSLASKSGFLSTYADCRRRWIMEKAGKDGAA